jgi:hypothetical protein
MMYIFLSSTPGNIAEVVDSKSALFSNQGQLSRSLDGSMVVLVSSCRHNILYVGMIVQLILRMVTRE